MSINRRNFLKNSAIGFAGATLVNPSDALGNKKEDPESDAEQRSGKDMDGKTGMTIKKTTEGWTIQTNRYMARIISGNTPLIHLYREGWRLMRMPAVSGLATVDAAENLNEIRIEKFAETEKGIQVSFRAGSSLWRERRFIWEFSAGGITYRHEAEGTARPGRCYFFANGPATRKGPPLAGVTGTLIEVPETYSPGANLSDEFRRPIAVPRSLGIFPETPYPPDGFIADRVAEVFAPPMLCLAFGATDHWMGIGLGAKPGASQFNGFEYMPAGSGAQFFVNYMGYSEFGDGFTSPVIALNFGYSPYEVLEQYAAWMDREGFSTRRVTVPTAWHRRPIFCGWGEQMLIGARNRRPAREEATQVNYEEMMKVIGQRGLPVGTLIIDDQWQEFYGTLKVDTTKWPDMAGFVRRLHDKGIHVLLWTPVHAAAGLPAELCVHRDGKAISADVSNPRYLEYLQERIRHLVRDIGIDGFKLDTVRGITREPGLTTHAPLHGIEWLHRYQKTLYDETHRWRPDALVEAHSTCLLFRDCADILRNNDLTQSSRNVAAVMEERSRLAHIAGSPLSDCDGSGCVLDEWWNCMQAQPRFGVPSLYQLSGVESDGDIPDWMWESLRNIWTGYLADCEGSVLNSIR